MGKSLAGFQKSCPSGVLGQVWCFIELIPDIYLLSYFQFIVVVFLIKNAKICFFEEKWF